MELSTKREIPQSLFLWSKKDISVYFFHYLRSSFIFKVSSKKWMDICWFYQENKMSPVSVQKNNEAKWTGSQKANETQHVISVHIDLHILLGNGHKFRVTPPLRWLAAVLCTAYVKAKQKIFRAFPSSRFDDNAPCWNTYPISLLTPPTTRLYNDSSLKLILMH